MTNGMAVRVMSQDGKRVLFIGSFRYQRDGVVRVFRCGHTTLVPAAQVLPLKGGLSR
jgi:hypothetical protein